MQKLLTLIITAGILYMIFHQGINRSSIQNNENSPVEQQQTPKQNTETKQTEPEISGSFLEKTLSSVMINVLKTDQGRIFMESILKPVDKTMSGSGVGFKMNNDNFIQSMFKISSFGDGEKGPASCGHIVTINYKIFDSQNNVIKNDIATFSLGSGKIAQGLDAIIVGMKTGETRNATIFNKYFQETQNDEPKSFKVSVLLKEIIPQNFVDESVKIFDDEIAYRIPLICGNKAIYDVKITRLSDSKTIYNSEELGKKINMQIGDLTYPMIFSHALHNKIPVGTRTVIAKGRFLKSYASDHSIIFPDQSLSQDDYFMIEFYNFDNIIMTKPATFP
jgi:hypothetical protein